MRFLALLVVSIASLASAQPVPTIADIQWPSGEGICSGPATYRLYNACSEVTIPNSARDSVANCSVVSEADVADASCPMKEVPATCSKVVGHQPPVQVEYKEFPCDGHCDDNFCRSIADRVRTAPDQSVTFIGGRPGEKKNFDTVGSNGTIGRKTQICTYNVSNPITQSYACTRPERTACKVQVKFAQACRNQFCGPEGQESYTSYGANMVRTVGKIGSAMVPGSMQCLTCEGYPALPDSSAGVEGLSPEWIRAKALCLTRQIGAFQQYSQHPAGAKAIESMVKSLSALSAVSGGKLGESPR
ncbi:MAG: hypothetical protein AB7F86_19855 [Bdellovibrionales bacterium]